VTILYSCAQPGPQPSSAPEHDVAVDAANVNSVIEQYIDAANGNNPEGLLTFVCDDVEAIPPEQAPVSGADAHQLYRSFFVPYHFAFDSKTTELVVSGDWAFRRYSYDITLTPKGGGDPIKMLGHGLHLFRRKLDGTWCVAKDFWNSVPPNNEGA
jgi:ketosteroid isomerase-like protein